MYAYCVAKPYQFYAATGKTIDAALAPAAPAPTLPYSKPTFLKAKKVT
jgi:hypothetical protein